MESGRQANSVAAKDKISPSFASFLDLSRAISAILVFLNHLRDPLFVGFPSLPADQRGLIVKVWFFVTGFGLASVMVFFVLSGFLVGGVGLSRVRDRSFQPSAYFIDRFTRLFVVLIPALLLTAVLDGLGQHFLGSIGLWDRTSPLIAGKFGYPFIAYGGWGTFACNLAMLQSFYCQVYSSNVPLWSLSYEFWFYICFGAAAVFAAGRERIVSLLCLAVIIPALGANFVLLAALWLFGVAAHAYRGERLRTPWLAIPLFLATAVVIRAFGARPPHGNMIESLAMLAEGAAFAWVLVSMRRVESRWLVKLAPLGGRLAGFSYTLYLIHFPVMLFVVAVLAKAFHLDLSHGVPPLSGLGIGLFSAVFVIVMGTAWLVASVTEAHTHHVRAWARRALAHQMRARRSSAGSSPADAGR